MLAPGAGWGSSSRFHQCRWMDVEGERKRVDHVQRRGLEPPLEVADVGAVYPCAEGELLLGEPGAQTEIPHRAPEPGAQASPARTRHGSNTAGHAAHYLQTKV